MARTIEIRSLRLEDDRTAFSCGEPALDRYFQHYAGQNQFKLRVSVTYVATTNERIVGFATITVGILERKKFPSARQRRRLPKYPLPILRLARLGVSKQVQGLGVGKALLRYVLGLAVEQSNSLGCVGVIADAKPGSAAFYEKFGFVPLEGVREGALHGEPTPMFLPVKNITAALSV